MAFVLLVSCFGFSSFWHQTSGFQIDIYNTIQHFNLCVLVCLRWLCSEKEALWKHWNVVGVKYTINKRIQTNKRKKLRSRCFVHHNIQPISWKESKYTVLIYCCSFFLSSCPSINSIIRAKYTEMSHFKWCQIQRPDDISIFLKNCVWMFFSRFLVDRDKVFTG